VESDDEGYQHSAVVDRSFRLDATRDEHGRWQFDLRSS